MKIHRSLLSKSVLAISALCTILFVLYPLYFRPLIEGQNLHRIINSQKPLKPHHEFRNKYFIEYSWNKFKQNHNIPKGRHYDARFFVRFLNPTELVTSLSDLFHEWIKFATEKNIEYVLAHGSLLGWYWGRKTLIWDTDLDIQLFTGQIDKLFQETDQNNTIKVGEKFLVDINPNFFITQKLPDNIIDMRFIDKSNGVFIDITALYPASMTSFSDKIGHTYSMIHLLPLRRATFNGVSTYIPRNVSVILAGEYGENSIRKGFGEIFAKYHFTHSDDLDFQETEGFSGYWSDKPLEKKKPNVG